MVGMVQALKQQVTIGPAGRVVIDRSNLPEGARAEVIILLAEESPRKPASSTRLADLIGKAGRSFASAQEADAFIRELRDEWDR